MINYPHIDPVAVHLGPPGRALVWAHVFVRFCRLHGH